LAHSTSKICKHISVDILMLCSAQIQPHGHCNFMYIYIYTHTRILYIYIYYMFVCVYICVYANRSALLCSALLCSVLFCSCALCTRPCKCGGAFTQHSMLKRKQNAALDFCWSASTWQPSIASCSSCGPSPVSGEIWAFALSRTRTTSWATRDAP
jgi:hypothetical protein